ncbi:MAG TPA: SxtJ family membrane protein [Bryobacteraceae bacterium]|nr:SxtJ family membrane protein [Bryobacteraceae bacterium]
MSVFYLKLMATVFFRTASFRRLVYDILPVRVTQQISERLVGHRPIRRRVTILLSGFRAQLEESEASDRSFGLLLGGVFFLLGLLRWFRGGQIRWWAVAAATVSLLLSLAFPAVLRSPKRAWLFLSYLLGRVINPIVLNLLFFVVITPAALLVRLTGRDPLCLKRDPNASSYWRTRTAPASDMNLQF